MSTLHQLLLLAAISYFLGSIPFGLLVGLAKGIDPRKAGSGNIGATNVARLLGAKFFALVFSLDLLKSLLPMLAGYSSSHHAAPTSPPTNSTPTLLLAWLLVGFAAILGHMFPIYIGFKGGKGVATSAGLILGLWPYYTLPALIALAILLILVFFKLWDLRQRLVLDLADALLGHADDLADLFQRQRALPAAAS
jgi:glycerol-3-phosphate acyltransferase PlsY